MIDYWLGGEHHQPVDVDAAKAFEAAYGPCAEIFMSLRRFLRRSVEFVSRHGIDDYLVFGSGIPTMGNVHEVATRARVLYTDIDPVTIALGRQALAGTPRTAYVYGDATDMATIDRRILDGVLPGWQRKPIGVVFLGLAASLDDPTLARVFDELYHAVAPGSYLIFDFDTRELAGHPEALAMMGPNFHMRDPIAFAPIVNRWRLTGDGIVAVSRWGLRAAEPGIPAAFYGGVAVK